MKRPEGFDGRPAQQPTPAKPARAAKPAAERPVAAEREPKRSAAQKPAPAQRPTPAQKPEKARKPRQSPGAARELRKAAAQRRRYERGEMRRFTRRSRRRRVAWVVAGSCVILLAALVTGAVYSPLLALKTVTITGTSRVDKSKVLDAVDGQVGTPLALLDFSRIKSELSAFPLIRSYATESVPPDTLIIRITERSPIGVLQTAKGYSVIDPAGVELQQTADRPANLPILTAGAALTKSPAFTASVDVLLALPADLLAKVDSVTAATRDNVTLTLVGGKTVVWGSDEQSALKGRVLAELIANQPQAIRYDVTAPTVPVFANQ
jgi:cell division protein FtsQ